VGLNGHAQLPGGGVARDDRVGQAAGVVCQPVCMASLSVLGPGGVGGFLAAALARAGEPVTVVGREHTAEAIARAGISVRSRRLGDFHARPRAVARLDEDVDALIVATKAPGLEEALDRVSSTPALVVPLLNGLDHMEVLRRRFGTEHVAAGAIRISSERLGTGEIVQRSPFLRIDLAAENPRPAAALPELAARLESAGVPARIEPSEKQILWSKLVRLNALALTTTASEHPIGFIRSDPEWRAMLIACIDEGAAAAAADGAHIDPAVPLAELDDAHPELVASLALDITAGRPSELDAIAGAVLRAADRHGLQCPTVARLAESVARRSGTALLD
jgi:2-dehydropantoate 2-reductase